MSETYRQEHPIMRYPARRWQQLAFKAPVNLWRLGLGPIVGHVLMLISHTGRKSGLTRRTLVEYHVLEGKKYAPVAFGEQAQWYQNILANPLVTIQTAGGAQGAIATRVTDDAELVIVYNLLMRRNPVMMRWYLDSLGIRDTPEDVIAKKDRIFLLRFDPTGEPTPPPLEADLWWVWIIGGGLLLGWLMYSLLSREE
jgi:deazaflavin-dependent oxidoreductase (nitroreductase family)